jgi:hypothetical protein
MNWISLKNWFLRGIDRLKWFASLFSERIQIELALIKLLNNIEELKRKRSGVVLKLGERVVGLKDAPTHDVMIDPEVKAILKEIEIIDEEIEGLLSKARELSTLEE